MQLKELVKNISFKGQTDRREIKAITYDSRKVKPGTLFVAISGMKNDGYEYISQAIENGATAVLSNGRSPKTWEIPILQVQDPRMAMSHISAQFYGNPSTKMNIIGVTGTNGKTSITYLLHHILQKSHINCGTLGTLGFYAPSGMISTGFTTPESIELQHMLNTLLLAGVTDVVMEISSHALNLHRVANVETNIAVYSNLTPEHLDFHGDMESYFNSKLKLFTKLNKKNTAVINLDDPYAKRIIAETSANIITYGMEKHADLYPLKTEFRLNGIQAKLQYDNIMISINSNLVGLYNLYNIMAAIAVCLTMDIQPEIISQVMQQSMVIPGRLESISANTPGKIFIDYAHTPDAYEKLFSTISSLCSKKAVIYTVFGCGGNRDTHKRSEMAAIAEKYSDFVTVTTDNPRTESLEAINSDIVSGFKGNNYEIILDRKDAIYQMMDQMDDQSILLVLGKGMENYQEIGREKIPYNDKKIIESYISAG